MRQHFPNFFSISCVAPVRAQRHYAILPAGGNANPGTFIKFVPAIKVVTVEHIFMADSPEGVNPAGIVFRLLMGNRMG